MSDAPPMFPAMPPGEEREDHCPRCMSTERGDRREVWGWFYVGFAQSRTACTHSWHLEASELPTPEDVRAIIVAQCDTEDTDNLAVAAKLSFPVLRVLADMVGVDRG